MEDREVERFWEWLISEEKSRATVDKYMRDIKKCWEMIGKDWNKEKLMLMVSTVGYPSLYQKQITQNRLLTALL